MRRPFRVTGLGAPVSNLGVLASGGIRAAGVLWLGGAQPFAARVTSDKLALGAFVLVLFGAWCAMRALGDQRARIAFLAVGGSFVGALVARPVSVLFLALGIALVFRAAIRRPFGWRMSVAFAVIALLLFSVARAFPAPAPQIASAADPTAETTAAIARGNLFQARLWAERWVAEHPERPADAALVLAEIDWHLGHYVQARTIAADVAAHGPDEDTRRRANERLLEWKESK